MIIMAICLAWKTLLKLAVGSTLATHLIYTFLQCMYLNSNITYQLGDKCSLQLLSMIKSHPTILQILLLCSDIKLIF